MKKKEQIVKKIEIPTTIQREHMQWRAVISRSKGEWNQNFVKESRASKRKRGQNMVKGRSGMMK